MERIELHLHTCYSSRCGKLDEIALIQGYQAAGYTGIVVTDHYNRETFQLRQVDLQGNGDKLGEFLTGYRHMKTAGEQAGIRIYRGAEVRFDGSMNDYLLFGWPDELLQDPEAVFTMGLEKFSALARAAGALLIQAHPYRKNCTPADHRFLDGVEVKNMHPGHENHNELAQLYADRWPELLQTGGSDCHRPQHIGRGGILAERLPADERDLVRLLRERSYTLIG